MTPTPDRDDLPLTVLVGDPALGGTDIYDKASALHVTVIDRDQYGSIDDSLWAKVPGVYILLDRPDPATGQWGTYVGKAPAGVKTRLRSHVREKDHWYRAVLVRSDTTHGYNSAEVAWLEGRLYDLMDAAENAVLHNGNRPVDETLPAFTRNALERAILPISRVLVLLGHDPSAADPDQPDTPTTARRTKGHVGVTLKQVLDGSDLQPGPLVSTNGVWPADATLNPDGTITVNGKTFDSPSGAASDVKEGRAANGWDFWATPGEARNVTLATYRKRYLETRGNQA